MNDKFDYDVFLSHSSKDKRVVRELAERMKKDGLRAGLEIFISNYPDAALVSLRLQPATFLLPLVRHKKLNCLRRCYKFDRVGLVRQLFKAPPTMCYHADESNFSFREFRGDEH